MIPKQQQAAAEAAAMMPKGSHAALVYKAIDMIGLIPKAMEKTVRVMPVRVPTAAPCRSAYFVVLWLRTVRDVAEKTYAIA